MTVVICTLNSKYIHCSPAPWYLLAGIKEHCLPGISGVVVEGTINEQTDEVLMRICDKKPHVVGFSCYIWNIEATIRLIKKLKVIMPDVITVLGGPEVSYNAGQILKTESSVDYIISGEGEKPFALFLNDILQGKWPQSIPGLCFRDNDQIVLSKPYISCEQPPSPYTEEYFEALKGRIAYLETSRGCPYHCAYCLSGRCGSVRFFDIDRAKKELLLLANSGTKTIKLIDRTFNANSKRANELFLFIINNYGKAIPYGTRFHFEIAGDILDNQTLDILALAPLGAMQLEIGLQSFNDKTLNAVNRKTNLERLKYNIKRLVDNANLHIHIDLIAGLPYEDYESLMHSFNTAFELRPNMLQLGFLKLLHGSPMRDRPDKYPCRFSSRPPYEVIETPWMSKSDLQSLHRTEDALQRLYNSGRFTRTIEYLLEKISCSPFELFTSFGEYFEQCRCKRISLDDFTALVFEYFSKQTNIDKAVLRDIMVCDRLSSNPSGHIPLTLKIKDEIIDKKLKKLKKSNTKKGVRRGVAYLYSQKCAVYADYVDKNPVTGQYPLTKVQLLAD
ncbi:MAG: DUF4080 domain-containing protein [Oscillospiraceae bacterium]|nr:DUF4080 domain-containing protein [Oscillospiraceae bacterium]